MIASWIYFMIEISKLFSKNNNIKRKKSCHNIWYQYRLKYAFAVFAVETNFSPMKPFLLFIEIYVAHFLSYQTLTYCF